jgi:DivIVA domain-containing protein
MPLTAEDVRNKRFTPVRLREGYDMREVDQFLDEVEAELARLRGEPDQLGRREDDPGPRPAALPGPRSSSRSVRHRTRWGAPGPGQGSRATTPLG